MKYRILGKTGYRVSSVGYGAWSLGADWGNVPQEQAMSVLHAVVDHGVNFIDTADVYGDGRSEKFVGMLLSSRSERIYVATKAGRRLNPHSAEGYTEKHLNEFVDRSRSNLGLDTLDLLQLHCPPTQVYYTPRIMEILEKMVERKKIAFYGVSVEKVEEARIAIEYPNLATVQIIFNMFRQRPCEKFFKEAKEKNVGIIARVPLASGLLSGAKSKSSHFPSNDHRNYNRHGEKFDVGETFAGVDFETGLRTVGKLKSKKPEGYTMAQFALKWILMHKEVATVIPGGKDVNQVVENIEASDKPELSEVSMSDVATIYEKDLKKYVHVRW